MLGLARQIISDDPIQPPIYSFMEGHSYPGLLLVVASDKAGRGHVFAARGRQFVDFYTHGQIASNVPPPKEWPDFRVKHVLLIRSAGMTADDGREEAPSNSAGGLVTPLPQSLSHRRGHGRSACGPSRDSQNLKLLTFLPFTAARTRKIMVFVWAAREQVLA